MIDLERELENEEQLECPDCKGLGGFDVSTECEVYEDWKECVNCQGTGIADESFNSFDHKREAFQAGD